MQSSRPEMTGAAEASGKYMYSGNIEVDFMVTGCSMVVVVVVMVLDLNYPLPRRRAESIMYDEPAPLRNFLMVAWPRRN